MTRDEFFKKVDEQLEIAQQDGWNVYQQGWSVFNWAKRLRSRVNPVPITDDDIKDHLTKNKEIADFMRKYQLDIDDIVNRAI